MPADRISSGLPPFTNTGVDYCWLVGLDLFNDDTCPSGHISCPTQVNVSQSCLIL